MDARVRELEAENARLRTENEQLHREVVDLRGRMEKLTAALEEARRNDERHEAPLPENCPHCGGAHVQETHTAQQYQTEIPRRPIHREFTVHVGH